MANIPPHNVVCPNVCKVRLLMSDNSGATFENSTYVHSTTAWDETKINALLDVLVSWFTVTAAPLVSTAVQLYRLVATDLTSLNSLLIDRVLPTPILGTKVGTKAPANVTYALKGNTGKRGKGRAGRWYWNGMDNTQYSTDYVTGAFQTAVTAAMAALRTAINGVSGQSQGIVHLFLNKIFQNPGIFDAILEWVSTDTVLDSQRDRLPGHKRHKKTATP